MDQNQVERIVEAINENFEAQNIVLRHIATLLEDLEVTLKLTAAALTQRERKLYNNDAESSAENIDA